MANLEGLADVIADGDLYFGDFFLYVRDGATGIWSLVEEVTNSNISKVSNESAIKITKSGGGYFEYPNEDTQPLYLDRLRITSGSYDNDDRFFEAPIYAILDENQILRISELKMEFS